MREAGETADTAAAAAAAAAAADKHHTAATPVPDTSMQLASSRSTCSWFCQQQRTQPPQAPVTPPTRTSRRAVSCRCQHCFVLYTKPDCPLCDGLKDKLQALIDRAAFMPCFLTGASLEVRDISTNEPWQDAMHLAVPVLALLDGQGQEVVLPRPQPRVSADRLQQHLQQALQSAGVSMSDSGASSSSSGGDQPFTVVS